MGSRWGAEHWDALSGAGVGRTLVSGAHPNEETGGPEGDLVSPCQLPEGRRRSSRRRSALVLRANGLRAGDKWGGDVGPCEKVPWPRQPDSFRGRSGRWGAPGVMAAGRLSAVRDHLHQGGPADP